MRRHPPTDADLQAMLDRVQLPGTAAPETASGLSMPIMQCFACKLKPVHNLMKVQPIALHRASLQTLLRCGSSIVCSSVPKQTLVDGVGPLGPKLGTRGVPGVSLCT